MCSLKYLILGWAASRLYKFISVFFVCFFFKIGKSFRQSFYQYNPTRFFPHQLSLFIINKLGCRLTAAQEWMSAWVFTHNSPAEVLGALLGERKGGLAYSDCSLCICTKQQFRLPGLLGVSGWVLERVSPGVSIVLMGDFNAHVDSYGVTWRGVTGRNDLPGLTGLVLNFCASPGLSITNSMFKHKVVYKCTWYQATLA